MAHKEVRSQLVNAPLNIDPRLVFPLVSIAIIPEMWWNLILESLIEYSRRLRCVGGVRLTSAVHNSFNQTRMHVGASSEYGFPLTVLDPKCVKAKELCFPTGSPESRSRKIGNYIYQSIRSYLNRRR